jgi:hypothetical protein
MSEIKEINCVVFLKTLSDTISEVGLINSWVSWSKDHKQNDVSVNWKFAGVQRELLDLIPYADFVFIDYSGMFVPWNKSVGLSFTYCIEQRVSYHQSTEFIILCTKEKEWYDGHYVGNYQNLHFENTSFSYLFNKYICNDR